MPILFEHATQLLIDIDQGPSLTEQVKSMLRLTLNDKVPSSELIANQPSINARTLQHRLGDEDTCYKEVLNRLRHELDFHYVKNTSLNLEVIAAKLRFIEARSFYRSLKP